MPITVPYVEMPGSGSNEFTSEGGTATRVFLCDYAQADQLCAELLGFPSQAGTEHQRRRQPERHPTRTHLYCRTCQYEGFGSPGREADGDITYTKAKVTAVYRPLDWSDADSAIPPTGTYMTERREFDREFESAPTSDLRWREGQDSGNSVGNVELLRRVPLLVVRIDVFGWLAAPIETGVFERTIGKVNDRDFRPLRTTWPAESLLYDGAWYDRQYTSDGQSAWRVALQFRFRNSGWNRRPHKSMQYFNVSASNGKTPYEPADFSSLLP